MIFRLDEKKEQSNCSFETGNTKFIRQVSSVWSALYAVVR